MVPAACALFGFECEVFMGASDIVRQKPNVQRMHLLEQKYIQLLVAKEL